MGAILIFVFYVIFQQFGFRVVAISGGVLPALAFTGALFLGEIPIFAQRYFCSTKWKKIFGTSF